MKIRTKQITVTAIMLAICILSQFFKNLSVYITGPIINAALILTILYAGTVCGIIFKYHHPGYILFHHRKPDYGSHSGNVPVYYDWKYHLSSVRRTSSHEIRCESRTSRIDWNRCRVESSFHGNLNFSDHSSDIPSGKNAADASRRTASVLADTADYSNHRRCICCHYCSSAEENKLLKYFLSTKNKDL